MIYVIHQVAGMALLAMHSGGYEQVMGVAALTEADFDDLYLVTELGAVTKITKQQLGEVHFAYVLLRKAPTIDEKELMRGDNIAYANSDYKDDFAYVKGGLPYNIAAEHRADHISAHIAQSTAKLGVEPGEVFGNPRFQKHQQSNLQGGKEDEHGSISQTESETIREATDAKA